MENEIAEKRVAVTPSLLEEIQDWADITDMKQYETLAWLIEQAKAHIAETRPDVMQAYDTLKDYKANRKIKVAI